MERAERCVGRVRPRSSLTLWSSPWPYRRSYSCKETWAPTTAKIQEETQTLSKFKSDLGVGDETLYNWTTEVQQWANTEFPECGPSMVVHTSLPFGVKHLEEAKEQVEPIILVKLNKLLPGLPQPDSIKCQKWRYSQVTSSVADCPGQMTPLSQPLFVCGGDGFTHSNFDGCIESALKVFDVLKSSL
ncbi:renalase-like isoform X5 [Salvelinus alpinus]